MNAKILLVPATALLGWAVPALAQVSTTAGQTQVARQADDNRVICKQEAPTGTRFGKRTCRTKAEWERIREQNQRDVKEMIDRPKIDDTRG